jgi:hypothetical protein
VFVILDEIEVSTTGMFHAKLETVFSRHERIIPVLLKLEKAVCSNVIISYPLPSVLDSAGFFGGWSALTPRHISFQQVAVLYVSQTEMKN